MSLTKQVFAGVKWVTITRLSTQLLNWAITLIVVRLLAPEDYGLLAIASGILAVLSIVNEMGLEAALVQKKQLEARLPERVFGFVLVANLLIFALVFSVAPYVASLYGEPMLALVIRVLAVNHLIFPFMVVPRAMLVRKMDFRGQGIVGFVSSTSSSLGTLTLALAGYGVWALVWGALLETIVRLIGILWIARYWCRPMFSFSGMRDVIKFGTVETLDRAVWAVQMQADALILGKMIGKEATGIYYIAKDLAWLPMRKIAAIINPVAFAGFSRAQESNVDISHLVLKATNIIAFIAFPVFFGLSCTAEEIVDLALGDRWLAVTFPLQVLSPVVALQLLTTAIVPALSGSGIPIVNLQQRLITLGFIVVGIFGGISWGINGVAVGASIAYFMGFIIQIRTSCRALNIDTKDYFYAIKFPLVSAVIMYFLVFLVRAIEADIYLHQAAEALLLVGSGALTYSAAIWILNKQQVSDVFRTLRNGFSR